MAVWVITEGCIDVKDRTCVDVCPADCIYELTEPGRFTTPAGAERDASAQADDRMLYINPDECIGCSVCEPVCPVNAIYEETAVPPDLEPWIDKNRDVFA